MHIAWQSDSVLFSFLTTIVSPIRSNIGVQEVWLTTQVATDPMVD
jgi:hypothetical protein